MVKNKYRHKAEGKEGKKMKRQKMVIGLILSTLIVGLSVTGAQPQPMNPDSMATAPPMVATMAPEPVAMVPGMVPAMVPPAAMLAPAMGAPAPAMTVPEAAPVAKPAAPKPEWKTATFWILKVVIPIITFILTLLVALGVIKKTWLQWLKDKKIVEIADKVATQFETYAKGTKPNWDDVLAQALKAVVTRLGELTPEEKAKVEAVIAERKDQAGNKVNE